MSWLGDGSVAWLSLAGLITVQNPKNHQCKKATKICFMAPCLDSIDPAFKERPAQFAVGTLMGYGACGGLSEWRAQNPGFLYVSRLVECLNEGQLSEPLKALSNGSDVSGIALRTALVEPHRTGQLVSATLRRTQLQRFIRWSQHL
jgi:hypothetical protein